MFIKVNMMCDKLLVYCRMLIVQSLKVTLSHLDNPLATQLAPQLETRLEPIVFATFFLSRRDGV